MRWWRANIYHYGNSWRLRSVCIARRRRKRRPTTSSAHTADTHPAGPDTGVSPAHSGTPSRQSTASPWPRPPDTCNTGRSLHRGRGRSLARHSDIPVGGPRRLWRSGTRSCTDPHGRSSASPRRPSHTLIGTPSCSGSKTCKMACLACSGCHGYRRSNRDSSGGRWSKACRRWYKSVSSSHLGKKRI